MKHFLYLGWIWKVVIISPRVDIQRNTLPTVCDPLCCTLPMYKGSPSQVRPPSTAPSGMSSWRPATQSKRCSHKTFTEDNNNIEKKIRHIRRKTNRKRRKFEKSPGSDPQSILCLHERRTPHFSRGWLWRGSSRFWIRLCRRRFGGRRRLHPRRGRWMGRRRRKMCPPSSSLKVTDL
jgi:hypothetical protein